MSCSPGHYAPTDCKCGHGYTAHRMDFTALQPRECQACPCKEYVGVAAPPPAEKSETVYGRCRTCGQLISRPTCPNHPTAERIPMTRAMTRALWYLHGQHARDVDMERWIETYEDNYWPGLTRANAALAWTYLRDWGGWIPEIGPPSGAPATPAGLFGS